MQLVVTNTKDVSAGRLVVNFRTGDSGYASTAARHCDQVVLNSGESPSYAVVAIPMANFGAGHWDEVVPAVALMNSGPAGAIKLRTPAQVRAMVGGKSVVVFNGYSVSLSHQIGEDSIIAELYDARWILSKYTCWGRLVWDPSTNLTYWDLTSDLVFDALGYPDCLDHPKLGPVFAPCHRYGYKNDFSDYDYNSTFEDLAEPEPGQALIRARSWRSQDAARYLQNHFKKNAGAPSMPGNMNFGHTQLPSDIHWPSSLGSRFGTDRVLKDRALSRNGSSMSLLQALQNIGRWAGAFDLEIIHNEDGSSTLGYCDMNPKSNAGVRLITPWYASSLGECMNSSIVVKSGNVRESFINGFDEVLEVGDGVALEEFMSMDVNGPGYAGGPGSQTSANTLPYTIALEPAWSDADEAAFKAYVVKYGGTAGQPNKKGTQQSFQAACRKWPLVFCAYRLKLGVDYWAGTKWDGMLNGGRPRVKPFQLTGYQQDQNNPSLWIPREIIVEYYQDFMDKYDSNPNFFGGGPASTDNQWYEAQRLDNLTLSPDSKVIMLSALRDGQNPVTWVSQNTTLNGSGHPQNDVYRGDTMRRRPLRIQLALESDWPIMSIQGMGGAGPHDPNRIYDRVTSRNKFTWAVTSQAGDYVEYLRHDLSRPVGAANLRQVNDVNGTGAFPARVTVGNELFTDRTTNNSGRIADHARARLKDVKRVELSASLDIETLAAAYRPGMTASLEGGATIPVFGVMKSIILRSSARGEQGQTTIILEPPDSSAIYDQPKTSYHTPSPPPKSEAAPTSTYEEGSAPSSKPSSSPSSSSYSGDYKTMSAPEGSPGETGVAPTRTGPPAGQPDAGKAGAEGAGGDAGAGGAAGAGSTLFDKGLNTNTPGEYGGKDYSQQSEYKGRDYSELSANNADLKRTIGGGKGRRGPAPAAPKTPGQKTLEGFKTTSEEHRKGKENDEGE